MRPLVSMRQALGDAALLGAVMGGESRAPMRSLLLASQGEQLTESELAHFRCLTERETPPSERVKELHVYAGRRSGKSSGCAALAVFISALCDHSDRLAAGEKGVVLLIAENQRQAKVLLSYISGIFDSSPALSRLVVGRTQTSISLSNKIEIEVRSADFRGLRGLTLACVIADEICHWRSEDSANPAEEIIVAVKPGLITTRGMLVSIGSPYAKSGYGYNVFRRDFGAKGDARVLVANGATRTFNSTIPQEEIDRAIQDDPAAAQSEWLGLWRADIQSFVDRAVVDACTVPGRFELPRRAGVTYRAFCDPSGGSSDSMTLAVGHKEGEAIIVDAIRERRPPFSPDSVAAEFAETMKSYGVVTSQSDRYGGLWPTERFREHGIRNEPCARAKSDLYKELLPLLNGGRIELPEHQKLTAQLCGLERRTARGGRDSIDHAPGCHDDIANAVAGLAALVTGKRVMPITDNLLNLSARKDPPGTGKGW